MSLMQLRKKFGFTTFRLDLNSDLETQGNFKVFLHKLTDIIALAEGGDSRANNTICQIENYISNHKDLIVIDPIDNVRQLLNRFKCYTYIRSSGLDKYGVFTPNFCEIKTKDPKKISEELKKANICYPFICKPTLGHGSKKAHEMMIVFNENSLSDCIIPAVAQSFVNHNAVLFKLFIVGDKYFYVERPSLKNFYAGDLEPIQFESGEVSKAGAQSNLSVLEPDEDLPQLTIKEDIFNVIAKTVRKTFGMEMLGVDVVVENSTEKYAIIDVNFYPGYDGFPDFYTTLFECIKKRVFEGEKDFNKSSGKLKELYNDSVDTHSIISSLT